jgi:hypothetical protein
VSAIVHSSEKRERLLEISLGAVLVLTVAIPCAFKPFLTVAAILALVGAVLIGPVRTVLFLTIIAVPLFPSLRNVAGLTTIRCDEFLLLALSALWLAQVFRGRRIVLIAKPIMLLQCAAIVWGLIGLGWLAAYSGTDIGVKSLFVTYRRVQALLLFFLVIQQVDTLEEAKRLLFLTILVSAVVSIIGLLQFADIGPARELVSRFYTIPGTTWTHPWRVTSTFDSHPNALGAYYVIVLSMVTAVIASSPRKFLNPVWMGILVLGYATVVTTASRASLLALFIGVVVIAVMRRIWLLGAIVPPVVAALYFVGGRMTERLVALYEAVAYGKIPTHHSLGQHLRHWSFALERMEDMPFVGRGFGGDPAIALNRYLDNHYLYLLYHEGSLSVLFFLGLLTAILLSLYRIAARCGDVFVKGTALGLFAATIGLSAHAIGADTFTWERLTMVLWFCLALVIRADSLVGEEGGNAGGTRVPSGNENSATDEIASAGGCG